MKLFIVLLAVLLVADAFKIVSLKKPTRAGPQGWGGKSARAVDGNIAGSWGRKSCTHSRHNKGSQNWWRVDLGRPHYIAYVRIWNRTDCCANRIDGAKVYAGGKLCGVVRYRGKRVQGVHCSGTVARTVTITQPNNYLTLCEVEVYGAPK